MELKIGLSHEIDLDILPAHSATAMQSGDVAVFATPAMIAMMERCAKELLLPYLAEGETSVGTHIDVKHLAPSAIGQSVHITATVTHHQGRRVQFTVKAMVDEKLIGEGMHRRVMVERQDFLAKVGVAAASNDSVE